MNLERSHGDRLVELWLDVPTRRVALVREERVDAGDGLLGILRVHFIFSLAILFRDCEHAQSLEGFKRVRRFRMEHAEPEKEIVAKISERQERGGSK